MTHLPTGIVVVSAEKSQHQKRRLRHAGAALSACSTTSARAPTVSYARPRNGQVGFERSLATHPNLYNYPQGRLTDHRINLTLHNIERVM